MAGDKNFYRKRKIRILKNYRGREGLQGCIQEYVREGELVFTSPSPRALALQYPPPYKRPQEGHRIHGRISNKQGDMLRNPQVVNLVKFLTIFHVHDKAENTDRFLSMVLQKNKDNFNVNQIIRNKEKLHEFCPKVEIQDQFCVRTVCIQETYFFGGKKFGPIWQQGYTRLKTISVILLGYLTLTPSFL